MLQLLRTSRAMDSVKDRRFAGRSRLRKWCRLRLGMLRRSGLPFALMVAGCTSPQLAWRRLDQPTPLKPDELVWIWSRGVSNKWHAVSITQDSVSGVPYELPLPCDSCRRRLPRSEIDSMQVAQYTNHSDSKVLLEGAAAIGAVLLLELALCSRGC